jgi:hypothetical protein
VERFHRFLNAAIGQSTDVGVGDQTDWDRYLDSALFTYRTLPIDGLDISPFEVMYGREPNLPIDNILFRENYKQPIETLAQYMNMLQETRINMHDALNIARQQRFERNKKNSFQKPPRIFKPGDKVYLTFPRGRFKKPGESVKFVRKNDGPYTVLSDRYQGLVYNLKHDKKNTEHLASVQRMIPVKEVVLPDTVVDLPLDQLRQFDGQRSDRPNDFTRQEMLSKQQELQAEADSEAAAQAPAMQARAVRAPVQKAQAKGAQAQTMPAHERVAQARTQAAPTQAAQARATKAHGRTSTARAEEKEEDRAEGAADAQQGGAKANRAKNMTQRYFELDEENEEFREEVEEEKPSHRPKQKTKQRYADEDFGPAYVTRGADREARMQRRQAAASAVEGTMRATNGEVSTLQKANASTYYNRIWTTRW